jgi:hypothetical protein
MLSLLMEKNYSLLVDIPRKKKGEYPMALMKCG